MTNVGFHFLRLFIAIFMTPFLLSRLGAEVYGIMPLVNSCIAFVILASGGIQNSVGRYFTLHLAKKEYEEANRYASTAFVLLAGITVLAFIPFVYFAWAFPTLLEVPAGHEMEARIVVLLLGINIFIPVVFSPHTIGLYAQQRFDLKNLVSFFTQILYVAVVIGSFIYIEANVIYLAAATVFSNVLATVLQARLSKRLVPTLKVSRKLFDRSKLKEVGAYSFWIFVTQINILLFLNTDYIIINKFLGSAYVTGYSLAARWNEMIRAVVMAAVGVLTPLITELEANENVDQIRAIMTRCLRLVLVLVTPPAVLLTLFSKELLATWVGPEYEYVSSVFWASILPLVIILSAMPAQSILTGMGKVKWVALVNLISAFANLLLSVAFIVFLNLGIVGVALGTSIALVFKNAIFIPIYAGRVIDLPVYRYFKEFLKPFIGLIPMCCLAVYLQSHFSLYGWVRLLSASALCTALYLLTAYFLIFNEEDKKDVKAILRRLFHIKKKVIRWRFKNLFSRCSGKDCPGSFIFTASERPKPAQPPSQKCSKAAIAPNTSRKRKRRTASSLTISKAK